MQTQRLLNSLIILSLLLTPWLPYHTTSTYAAASPVADEVEPPSATTNTPILWRDRDISPLPPSVLTSPAGADAATLPPAMPPQAPVAQATEADLALTIYDTSDPLAVGERLTYHLTVTNHGPDSATNVVLTNTLPTNVTVGNITGNGCGVASGVVTCDLGELAHQAEATISIEVTPNTAETLISMATIRSDDDDPDPTNNTATQETILNADRVTLVGQYGGTSLAVAYQGSYAYLGVGPRMVILDVSNPATPTFAGETDILPGIVRDIVISGAYAYLANGSGGLRIFDITDPTAPTEIGAYRTYAAYDVVVSGDYAYVADHSGGSNGGLLIIDITNPTRPNQIGAHFTNGNATGVAVTGNYAFVTDRSFYVHVFDITDRTNPVKVGDFNKTGYAYDVAISGDYAYVVSGVNLCIFNITNPEMPTATDCINVERIRDVVASGDYAYVAANDFTIVDITNPFSPIIVGSCDMPISGSAITLNGNYAYVVASGGGADHQRYHEQRFANRSWHL